MITQEILDEVLKRTLEDPRVNGTSGGASIAHGIMMSYLIERFKTMSEDEIVEALNRRMYEILCKHYEITPR